MYSKPRIQAITDATFDLQYIDNWVWGQCTGKAIRDEFTMKVRIIHMECKLEDEIELMRYMREYYIANRYAIVGG